MAQIQLPIATGFYQSASLPLAAQRCINAIPVVPQGEALNQRALFGTPGITQIATGGNGANRGAMLMSGVPYFVNGTKLVSLSVTNTATEHGDVPGSGRVAMANNGRYLAIVVASGECYVFDKDNSNITKVTSANYQLSSSVVFKDGYFVFSALDGAQFFNSALNDPFTFNALDFGTAEINPDRIVALHVNHNELFVCGEETIELFQNVGGSGFPFQRIPGANIQKGVYAPKSLAEFDNSFVFIGGGLGERPAIWKMAGSSSVAKVSTSAIDNAIQQFNKDEIEAAFSWVYSDGGNFYVGFTFESERIPSKTFVFDATTSALSGASVWHERQTGVTDNRWRANSVIYVYGRILVGDNQDGRIGELDLNVYTEYGNVISRVKTSMPFSSEGLPLFSDEVRLTMEAGVGLTTGQGSDPVVRMDYSDDGARTFSSEFSRSFGKIGEYQSLPTWRRMGRIPRHRVMRFTMTDPVKFVIIKMEASAEQGFQ